jgi:hypothetical protein
VLLQTLTKVLDCGNDSISGGVVDLAAEYWFTKVNDLQLACNWTKMSAPANAWNGSFGAGKRFDLGRRPLPALSRPSPRTGLRRLKARRAITLSLRATVRPTSSSTTMRSAGVNDHQPPPIYSERGAFAYHGGHGTKYLPLGAPVCLLERHRRHRIMASMCPWPMTFPCRAEARSCCVQRLPSP